MGAPHPCACCSADACSLPTIEGTFLRGVKPEGLGARRTAYVKSHTHRGRIVSWEGYTSIMAGKPFEGSIQFIIQAKRAVDLGPLSVQKKPELVLPRGTKIRILDYERFDGYLRIEAEEVEHERPIRGEHRFGIEA